MVVLSNDLTSPIFAADNGGRKVEHLISHGEKIKKVRVNSKDSVKAIEFCSENGN